MSLGYFSLMELLQAFTYSVINQCDNPSNQVATVLGYLHITFQPFFINAVSLYFIDKHIARKIAPVVYTMCFFSAILMLLQLYPFSWAGSCVPGLALCGETLCSFRGNWHIAWSLPTNGMLNGLFAGHSVSLFNLGFPSYGVVGFLLPLLYGSWRFTLYHFMIGIELASHTTTNVNEWPAIWCLFSIGLLLVVIKTPVRKLLFVNRWWLWPAVKEASAAAQPA